MSRELHEECVDHWVYFMGNRVKKDNSYIHLADLVLTTLTFVCLVVLLQKRTPEQLSNSST